SHNEEIKKITKEINLTTDNLIKSLKPVEIENLKEKKSDLLLKRSELTNKLVSFNKRMLEIDKSLNEKDDGFVLANGTLNWNKTFDIKKYEKNQFGTWSITVISKDDMNNQSKEESINIKIDPKSDIPSLNIINPKPNARVPGNLMVVGTAMDDDGVGRVDMYLNGEKKARTCVGTDFWYYDLDTSAMKDGMHNLKFKVFDINGVPSQEYNVTFNLDRRMPTVTVDSMISGAIVSGKMNIRGKAFDDNGITKIEYSIDDRYSFLPIINKRNLAKDNTKMEYQVTIDSDKLIDGIQTVWFRAVDKTESVGYFPLTITVDHKTPTVEIQYPKDKSKIGDRFVLYGVAKDDVEMKHIILKIEGPGAYPNEHKVLLLPGNPYWSFNCQSDLPKLIDLSKFRDGMYKFTVIAEDVAGNKKSTVVNVNLDRELEKPTLNLTSFKKDDAFSSILPLYGTVNDDDGMKEVVVNIFKDGKKEIVFSKIVPSPYSFSDNIDISNLVEGRYRLELVPTDYYVKGNPINVEFWIDRSYPKFDVEFINKEWAGKTLNGKLDIPVKVIKYGDLKSVKYSISETTRNIDIIKSKSLKIIQ
ncbi:MAG TPA: Ig-like domain-containing protein, partial [Spirochaetota bacterium]|nr:Ig-like domain-containing protein [Spirochaetota bacterium]